MGSYLSPGLYPKETDFSFYVKQISTSVAAMIGIAEKGPINKPVLVTSWEQFTKTFGAYLEEGYLAYAARAFFDNGGSVLWVIRIAHYASVTERSSLTAKTSSIVIQDTQTPATDLIRVSALNEGTWGDKVSVVVSANEDAPTALFDLQVNLKANRVEKFVGLSMDRSLASYVETAINGISAHIVVEDQGTSTDAVRLPATGSKSLIGGDNGLASIGDLDFIGDPSIRTGIYATAEIDELNMLMVPGVSSASLIAAAIGYAESRKDLLFIAEAAAHLEPTEVVEFRKGQGSYTHSAFNSSYAALYYPWLEIQDPLSGKAKLVPPSGAVAGCIARSDQKTQVWYAPAGIDRGRIFGVLGLAYKTSQGERDTLYPAGVNVIASFPDSGVNIWGQKTLQSQPSATDRINVRRLMMYMEKAISQSSRFVVFEPNHEQTWRSLGRTVEPFLQDIKLKGGMYDFAFQCDEETNTAAVIDRNEMVARVFVKPTRTAEFIELNFILTSSGADFSEVL